MRFTLVFGLSVLFLLLLLAFNIYSGYHVNHTLVYPLDDAYIHMAISRNLAENGVWGITRFGFSSTSSSILYTLVLATAFKLGGVSVWTPVVLNTLVAIAILFLMSRLAIRYLNTFGALAINAAFIVLVPLPGMTMLGMEHTLQIFFTLAFLWLSWKKWNAEKVSDLLYFFTAFFAVMARYESVFLLGWTAAAWLLLHRNWKQTLLLAAAMALPIIGFGLFAMSEGGLFFPNSLLVKSSYLGGSIGAYVTELAKKILANPLVFSLLLLPFLYWTKYPLQNRNELSNRPGRLLMLILALTTISHIVLANFGWLFRYEAYLIALLFGGLVLTWPDWQLWWKQQSLFTRVVWIGFAIFLLFPILMRVQILSFTNRASRNIGDQQVRMAGFLHQYYPSEGVAINDIGAVSFFNKDLRIFDMEGLGTLETLKVRKHLDSSFLSSYAQQHHIRIGIFYPHLYAGKIPSSWQQVGTWELTDNFVTGGSIVGFYVIDPSEKERMRSALIKYSRSLPPNVIARIP